MPQIYYVYGPLRESEIHASRTLTRRARRPSQNSVTRKSMVLLPASRRNCFIAGSFRLRAALVQNPQLLRDLCQGFDRAIQHFSRMRCRHNRPDSRFPLRNGGIPDPGAVHAIFEQFT